MSHPEADHSSAAQPSAGGDSSGPWENLASSYELRAREDSLDRIVEWPAQRALLGDVGRPLDT
jgi:hypothetical protein